MSVWDTTLISNLVCGIRGASPTLSYLAVDGKSTEVSGLIDALVLLLFNFQVTIHVHVVVVSCTSRDSSAVF